MGVTQLQAPVPLRYRSRPPAPNHRPASNFHYESSSWREVQLTGSATPVLAWQRYDFETRGDSPDSITAAASCSIANLSVMRCCRCWKFFSILASRGVAYAVNLPRLAAAYMYCGRRRWHVDDIAAQDGRCCTAALLHRHGGACGAPPLRGTAFLQGSYRRGVAVGLW